MHLKRWILAGAVASMVMGVWEMALEQFVGGNGFWAPVTYIAATVLRGYQDVATPVPFALIPVVVGLMGNMMNSVVLGAIFAKIAPRADGGPQGIVSLGAAYGVAVLLAMWLLVLPLVDPVMLRLNFVIFALAHIMWGIALGGILAWQRPVLAPWRNAVA